MAQATARLHTIGEIARSEGVPAHRISYAVDSYRIEPTQRAGIIRMFSDEKVEVIRAALRRIADRRGGW